MTNKEIFLRTYTEELTMEVIRKPREFAYPATDAARIAEKMVTALGERRANLGSNAIRRTCRILKVQYSLSGISNFLNEV